MIVAWLAAVSLLAGALCLYCAAPHQALLAVRGRPAMLRALGSALLAVALALLLMIQGPATAIFTWATGATAIWTVVPVAVRWWRFRAETMR